MEDIEIARNTRLKKISEIAKKINIDEEDLELYGKYKAKISSEVFEKLKNKNDGKLVLVTAINPTPLGEGKTTVAIGLADGLNRINKNAVLALREPSLGPVFGIKGGATGGGYAQVAPMEDINLHFTGDIHAITAANNLLSAMIDNHIFSGNELKIKKVTWKRCLDLNDRALRKVQIGLSNEKNMTPRMDGYDEEEKPVFARDLKVEGAMTVLLKDAINPNLVQTLEGTPAIIHGGPFANIAHGCNSIRATKLALKLGNYVITEAGFGADLGAEKFLDIKCRKANLKPDCIVCVATLKALKYHGGVKKEEVKEKNLKALKIGIENLLRHVDNLQNKFNQNVIVAINRYKEDDIEEIKFLEEKLKEVNVNLSLTEVWAKGGEGAIDLANKITALCEIKKDLKFMYDLKDNIKEKIKNIAIKVYGAKGVTYSEEAENQIKEIEKLKLDKNFPICIAKTQYSFSDDPKNLLCNNDYDIHIKEIILKNGAEFIVAIAGKIMTMPGLPKIPAAEKINIDNNGIIEGIF